VTEVIVNAHHFPEMIVDYLKQKQNFGMRIEISREDVLVDTGGGLKKAAWFFLENHENSRGRELGGRGFSRDIRVDKETGASAPEEPFILHNVDVLSNVDLRRMAEFHAAQNALATLMVQNRQTSRPLLFDEQGSLCGRRFSDGRPDELARIAPSKKDPPARQAQPLAFGGIHIISPRLLSLLTEEGAFSIIPAYLRLAAQGEKIAAFRADDAYWRDLGNSESLQRAAEDLRHHRFA
jgi:NDP-sugar pyrophosphorylase family protein